jgi:hypothetical protein
MESVGDACTERVRIILGMGVDDPRGLAARDAFRGPREAARIPLSVQPVLSALALGPRKSVVVSCMTLPPGGPQPLPPFLAKMDFIDAHQAVTS